MLLKQKIKGVLSQVFKTTRFKKTNTRLESYYNETEEIESTNEAQEKDIKIE